jgi:hypothetical protein
MAEDHKPQPTQTTPTGAKIPIPTRDAFLRDLAKVAPPVEPQRQQDEPANDE